MSERMLFQIFISRMIEPRVRGRGHHGRTAQQMKSIQLQRERGGQGEYLISANSAFTVVNTLFDEREREHLNWNVIIRVFGPACRNCQAQHQNTNLAGNSWKPFPFFWNTFLDKFALQVKNLHLYVLDTIELMSASPRLAHPSIPVTLWHQPVSRGEDPGAGDAAARHCD